MNRFKYGGLFALALLVVSYQNCARNFETSMPVGELAAATSAPTDSNPGQPDASPISDTLEMNPACPTAQSLPSQTAPLSNGIDEIIKGEAYVVYSSLDKDSSTLPLRMDGTVSIYVLRGNPIPNTNQREVVIFGAGYGDPNGSTKENAMTLFGKNFEVVKSAAYDTFNVGCVINNYFKLSKEQTRIQFFSPHGHQDHVNAEFFRELEYMGYSLSDTKIYVGAPDNLATRDQNMDGIADWPMDLQNKVTNISNNTTPLCGEKIGQYAVAAGTLDILSFTNHTEGTINLLLKEKDHLFLGSDVGECSVGAHAQFLPAHGRARVGGTPPKLIGGNTAGFQKMESAHDHSQDLLESGCF